MKIEDGQDSFTRPGCLAWHTAGSSWKTKQIHRFKCYMASVPARRTAVFNSYFLFSQQPLGSCIIISALCSCGIFMLYKVCCRQSLVPLSHPVGCSLILHPVTECFVF